MVAETSRVKVRVLLVEDHDALREVVSETLERYACQVTGVDCAEAVCELPSRQVFDVAVLDLNLPGEDGLVLAQRLRAAQPALGIVMMTARREREDRLQGYQHGADVYLGKPVDADELALAADHTMVSWQLLEVIGREVDERGTNQLRVILSRLRRKLKSRGLETPLIRADRGKGYRLCVPLRLT